MFSQVGETVFFWHPKHAWVIGELQSLSDNKQTASVTAKDPMRGVTGETIDNVKATQVVPLMGGFADEDVEDLMCLTVLHDATLLRCLFLRYMRDHIYTNIGAILVAMNPFSYTIPWYKDECMSAYLDEGSRVESKLPHTWAVSHNTYFELIIDESAQFILVSGESGSGKTEACKIVVKYLSAVSSRRARPDELAACTSCGAKLIQCSPILESFGNARTLRNDNSSRFGKFMKIKFTKTGVLAGAHTTRYLLEKSRIISAAKQERVFHAFYLLLRGPYKSSLNLMADKDYASLNSGGLLNNSDYDTSEHFSEVVAAMTTVGLSKQQIDSAWAVTAGIVTLLNTTFEQIDGGSAISNKGMEFVLKAAALWHLDAETLASEMTRVFLTIKGERTVRRFSVAEAKDARDAACKALYDSLFGWLVERCNDLCDHVDEGPWIGLLDIFGFEDFEHNGFEQLCINLTNETLQGHYNEYVFTKDIEECQAEGINTTSIICPDNTACLEMIASQRGSIFSLLDDQCFVGEGTEQRFCESVVQQFDGHPHFVKDKFGRRAFAVRHFAGPVSYEVDNWLEKNRDSLRDSVRVLMRNSTDEVIASLLSAPVDLKGKKFTVNSNFRTQLNALMLIINSSNPHWIRCIKPHAARKPRMFDGMLTNQQLESSGVLGTVKIRKAGYPVRFTFEKFVDRFYIIYPTLGLTAVSALKEPKRGVCERILMECLLLDNMRSQIGKTKVFLKSDALTVAERTRTNKILLLAGRIQRNGRGLTSRRRTSKLRFTVRIQRVGRGVIERRQTAISIVARATALILAEIRSFLARTADSRAARAKFLEELRETRRRVSQELLSEHDTQAIAMIVEYAEQRARMMQDLMVTCEAMDRKVAEQTEKMSRGEVAVRVGLNFVERNEEIKRFEMSKGPLAVTLHLLQLEYVEQMQFLLIAAERHERLVMISEWSSTFFDSASSSAFRALLLRLNVVEEANRMKIKKEQVECRNANLVSLFYQKRLDDLETSWVAGSERHGRWEIVQEEFRVRQQRAAFERRVVWRALLAQCENEECTNRSYVMSHVEPRERAEILSRCMEFKRVAASKMLVASFFQQERAVRVKMWAVQTELWDSLLQSFSTLRFYIVAADHENTELTFRFSIMSTEATLRELFTRERMTGRFICAASDVMMNERDLRVKLQIIEASHRDFMCHHGLRQQRLLWKEHVLRQIVGQLFLLQRSEVEERFRVEREESNFRFSMSFERREGVRDLEAAARARDEWSTRRMLHLALKARDEARVLDGQPLRKRNPLLDNGENAMQAVQEIQDHYYAMPLEDRDIHKPLWVAAQKVRQL